ncbi:MAG: hypothetical protein SGJ23_00455 [Alphaproteobacteria bacterium]|nr:hypothetical protein [Alphaproteobacteria bacterium]
MSTNLYRNPRAWRARVAQAAIWIGLVALATIPLNAPPPTDADTAVYIGGMLLMIGAVIGMEIYLRRYVVAIDVSEGGADFTTLATLGHRRKRHGRGELRYAGERQDRFIAPGAPSVKNEWISIHDNRGRFAYVLDITPPATIDAKALKRALG